ncbi:MAG: hypothetical protein HY222_07370 [Thaumarchaeota archaeon]|nr:hypothetical protein [Nitrososphaerota archaeon]MBI3642194.1 hypothetical protein [Nitrososphaerota archaeon]
MFTRTKNRKAISAVLTTLIILVASVVLGTGVVLYGTSLFQTGAQSAGISTQGVHVWANSTSTPTYVWGAAEIRNSGDKILSVDTISVRGTQVPFANWYFDSSATRVTAANFQSQLNYTQTNGAGIMKTYVGTGTNNCVGASFAINEFGTVTNPTLCFTQATGPISLKPGDKAIVYFQVPNGVLSTVDAGSQSSVAIYAGNVGAPQTITVESK